MLRALTIAFATGGTALAPVTVEHDYSEALPSATLRLNLSEKSVLRFGASRVVARPPLDELRASRGSATSTTARSRSSTDGTARTCSRWRPRKCSISVPRTA